MTVLHLTDCGGGGVPTVIDSILSAIPGQVAFVGASPPAFGQRASIALETGGQRTKNPIGIARNLRSLVKGLHGQSFDVIHAHSSFGGIYGALLSRELCLPMLYSPHASPTMIPGKSWPDRLISRLEWISCRAAYRVIACSEDEAQALRQVCLPHKIVVVPNGVQVDVPIQASTEWDVLAVGRLSPQKRPDLFVQLVQALRLRLPGLRAAWVGPGDPLPGEGIQWLGEVSESEVLRLLGHTRAFVSTSDYEGLSLAALKAACAGCHLFLRDTIGNRSPVRMGANGLLFEQIQSGATLLGDFLADSANLSLTARTDTARLGRSIFSMDGQLTSLRDLYASTGAVRY
jgi:glycosyltransferase involved in cell wall biosynthesis